MLNVSGLTKTFGNITAVSDVSLSVPSGQMVGIIGRSGAGKSTMLRLVNRLIDPTSGTVECDGRNVTGLKGRALRRWRADCAMIFQQFNLVNRLDVITNVMIGRVFRQSVIASLGKSFTRAERAQAILALERLDLAPQALQRTDTLSGGQQQRVAIARALVQQPRIILADEPIASLDPNNAQKVMDSLRRNNREDGISILCNLHHLDTAQEYCDRIIAMAQGRIVLDGTPDALTAGVIEAIYGEDAADAQWQAAPGAPASRRDAA
jgi:phosphonate transport system ATP-binding protein